jgi:hypothetical protein
VDDESAVVRQQVLHTLCDGSPACREEQVIEAVERLARDADPKVRKQARRVINEYRRSGRWNIL